MKQITLGGGCFWCIEAIFSELNGVESAISGYAGGDIKDPTYEQICSGKTGHAEVVQISYNPDEISLREILEIFFTIHDPTTLNRQGADIGTQYRSIVFYNDELEKKVIEEVMEKFDREKIWKNPIVTEVKQFDKFYPAEEYHQNYYRNNPQTSYCRLVIEPKVVKFRKQFLGKLKNSQVQTAEK